jgi:hypothetical protein
MSGQKLTFDLRLTNKIFKANLTSLINVSEDSIREQKRQYEVLMDRLANGTEDKDWFDKGSHYANVEWILLNSILLSAFSFFEHRLFKLCRVVEDKSISKIQIGDISGKGIIKFCNYLFLVGEIQNADRGIKEWQEINYFQKVRNLIAHNGGIMISDPSKKLENHECFKFLSKHHVIMAGSLGHIRIRDLDFIKTFKDLTANLSDKLTTEISTRFP